MTMAPRVEFVLLAEDALSPAYINRIASTLEGWATWERISNRTPEAQYRQFLQRTTSS